MKLKNRSNESVQNAPLAHIDCYFEILKSQKRGKTIKFSRSNGNINQQKAIQPDVGKLRTLEPSLTNCWNRISKGH